MEKEALDKLNELTGKSLCIRELYAYAKERAVSDHIAHYFKKKSEERKEFSNELIRIIYNLGGKFEEEKKLTETNAGEAMAPQALSVDAKDLTDQILLNETIKANRDIIGDYEELLTEFRLPDEQASILKKQLSRTEKTASEVKFAEDI
jgi:hypothetical protein